MAPEKWPTSIWLARSSSIWVCLSILSCLLFWSVRDPQTPQTYVIRRHTESPDLVDLAAPPKNATLIRRDEYNCGPNKPCGNGACCGKSGYCGYGPTYCGNGCVSNCGAVAECGKYAKASGQQCPLNTCCSEFGYCGTTKDFCGEKCQSNCVLDPKPPGGGSSTSIVKNKVIGYYESWGARLNCHKIAPTDLPLDALTHINYAFGYIDPKSLQIVTMDGQTPESLFKETTNIKSIKQDLEVWVSVGGWTFSDNGTATQPLYGEIAGDDSKRQTFADNVVRFLKQYGFDGLDIDWEYPGAPDRGGKPEDTKNYVALLETLRKTFDGSGNKFGLTFTAPSSYWYLRWFDLPNMIKCADWINFMSYDLHGVWDATNPIGNIVQGHTNLTEIKLAADLFWRVKIPPAKIVMGFGFYGRAYTLADGGCSKPGCAFKGAAEPGPCTATGGYLAYYEIMDILDGKGSKKRAKIEPTYDKENAVNYFTFGDNQWVSYDDSVTFKQKVDWANGVGLGGGLIWASDLDDNKYSAHAGLLGRSIKSTSSLKTEDKALSNPQAVIQDLAGSNGQHCFAYTGKCVNLNDNQAMALACGPGNTPVGWDDAGCGTKKCHCGKPICCPTNEAPKNCIWRGNHNGDGAAKSDCSAQCAPGETNIKGIGSSWGGGFLNDGNTNKCARGYKVFCCPNPDFPQVTRGCEYAKCRSKCPTGKKSVFQNHSDCFVGYKQYCCPDPPELTDCHWEQGSGTYECANAKCKDTELEIDRDQFGGSQLGGCSWGRSKAACCTVQKAPPPPAYCTANLCKDLPGFCPNDDDDESANSYTKRTSTAPPSDDLESVHILEERGGSHTYNVDIGNNINIQIIAIAYPGLRALFNNQRSTNILRRFFRLIAGYCVGPSIAELPIPPGTTDYTGLESEHPIDRQVIKPFAQATANGVLPSGQNPGLPAIPRNFWQNQWLSSNTALAARPAVGGPNGRQPNTPNNRVMEAFGSSYYPDPFMALDQAVNGAKGRIMGRNPATAIGTITDLANSAVTGDTQGHADELLQAIRIGFATFDYLNTQDATNRWNQVRQQIRTQFGFIEQDLGVPNLVAWWDVFTDDYFAVVEHDAQVWATAAIHAAAAPFTAAHNAGRTPQIYEQVVGALEQMLTQIRNMRLPRNNGMLIPQPPGGGNGGGGGGGGS